MQELRAHLAAEITRLCSVAKQDELPVSQVMDLYGLEVRVRCVWRLVELNI